MTTKAKNDFGVHKLRNFGILLKNRFPSWFAIEMDDEFEEFVEKHGITNEQIHYIKLGFEGKKIEAPSNNITDGIFPFGVHKGKPMNKVPIKYYEWCQRQEWIDKWPTVKAYCVQIQKDIDAYRKEYELGMEELKNWNK